MSPYCRAKVYRKNPTPVLEQITRFCVKELYLSRVYCQTITVLKGEYLSKNRIVIFYIEKERSCTMFVLAAVVVVLLLALAGSDMYVSQYSQDELSNMGVQEQ